MKPTAPVPAKLRRLLVPSGLRARIVIERTDGAPVTPDEVAEVRTYVAMLDTLDARTAKALAAVARCIPAAMLPAPAAAPAKPRKASPKRRAAR